MPVASLNDLFNILESTFEDFMKGVRTANECAGRVANGVDNLRHFFEENNVRVCMPRNPFF
jgi:hypothetical protein